MDIFDCTLVTLLIICTKLSSSESPLSTTTLATGSNTTASTTTSATSNVSNTSLFQGTGSDNNDGHADMDPGKIAGIVIGVIGGLVLIATVVAFFVYKQYVRRNVKSMNFDNPVYRKTTEDQFSLEKNQYHPARSYPVTLEPLNNPGTNEFV